MHPRPELGLARGHRTAKVTIFRVEAYAAKTDSVIRSKRMATLKGVMKMNG
jgi:hypothetical protein